LIFSDHATAGGGSRGPGPPRRRLFDLLFEVKDNLETIKYWILIVLVIVVLVNQYQTDPDSSSSKKLARHVSKLLKVFNDSRLDYLLTHHLYPVGKEEVYLTTPSTATAAAAAATTEDYDHSD
jgi:hypothetical protein